MQSIAGYDAQLWEWAPRFPLGSTCAAIAPPELSQRPTLPYLDFPCRWVVNISTL
jgi:hypothetical protein